MATVRINALTAIIILASQIWGSSAQASPTDFACALAKQTNSTITTVDAGGDYEIICSPDGRTAKRRIEQTWEKQNGGSNTTQDGSDKKSNLPNPKEGLSNF